MTITENGDIIYLKLPDSVIKGGGIMLNNLKAELVRKNLVPEKAVEAVLGCTSKTAKAKLNGESDFSLPEAIGIVHSFFANDNFSYEFLFENSDFNEKGA